MNVSFRYVIIFSVLAILYFTFACFKHPSMHTGAPRGVAVNLPRVKYAEGDAGVLKDSAVVVTVPLDDEFYIGDERFPKDDLGYQIGKKLKDNGGATKIVYVAGGVSVSHGSIVSVLDRIRMQDIDHIGLIVEQQPRSGDAPRVLKVQVLPPPSPDEDLSKLKPDPLTLVVSLNSELKIELNREAMGTVDDLGLLESALVRIFQQRRELRAYRPGTETRTDLPESERVEKTITIKAPKPSKYGDVVRLIDAVRGAGANPIILQLDDLP